MISLPEEIFHDSSELKKINDAFKKLNNQMQIVKYSAVISFNSGIGPNTILKVIVKMKDENFSQIETTLTFDISNYNEW